MLSGQERLNTREEACRTPWRARPGPRVCRETTRNYLVPSRSWSRRYATMRVELNGRCIVLIPPRQCPLARTDTRVLAGNVRLHLYNALGARLRGTHSRASHTTRRPRETRHSTCTSQSPTKNATHTGGAAFLIDLGQRRYNGRKKAMSKPIRLTFHEQLVFLLAPEMLLVPVRVE
jgi:hypothetical protein